MRPPPPLPSPRLKNPPRFAVKVVEHAQTYWRLLARVNPRDLRLTSIDDEIYNDLMETFPELNQEPYEKLAKIDEDWMKNPEGKKRWAEFMNRCVFRSRSLFLAFCKEHEHHRPHLPRHPPSLENAYSIPRMLAVHMIAPALMLMSPRTFAPLFYADPSFSMQFEPCLFIHIS